MAPPSRPAACLKVRPGGPQLGGRVESAFGTISWVQRSFFTAVFCSIQLHSSTAVLGMLWGARGELLLDL